MSLLLGILHVEPPRLREFIDRADKALHDINATLRRHGMDGVVATNTTIATGTSNSNKTVNFTVPSAAVTGTTEIRLLRTSAISASLGSLLIAASVTGWLSARTGATRTITQGEPSSAVGSGDASSVIFMIPTHSLPILL